VEEQLALVDAALSAGEYAHAVHHLAQVIGADPSSGVANERVDRLVALAPDALALVPVRDGVFHGLLGLRAEILARLSRTTEAVEMVLIAQSAMPSLRYAESMRAWLATEEDRARVDLAAVFGPFTRALGHEGNAFALAPLLRAFEAERAPDPHLAFLGSMAYRRAGRPDLAVGIARAAHTRSPNALTSIALGTALRATGEIDGAITAFEQAIAFDPDDDGARLDVADMQLDRARWDEAIAAYDAVLARQPNDAWAKASMLFARVRRDGDASAKAELSTMRGNARAEKLLAQL
jgi:tetratricopeptide (TPR) repeat protein